MEIGDVRGALDGFFGTLGDAGSTLMTGAAEAGTEFMVNWAGSQFKEQETSPLKETTYIRPANVQKQNSMASSTMPQGIVMVAVGLAIGLVAILMLK